MEWNHLSMPRWPIISPSRFRVSPLFSVVNLSQIRPVHRMFHSIFFERRTMSKPILTKLELGTLKGMAVYWRGVFERDDLDERQRIAISELTDVIDLFGAEIVLRMINEYVKDLSDKEPILQRKGGSKSPHKE